MIICFGQHARKEAVSAHNKKDKLRLLINILLASALKNREFLKKWALTKAKDWKYEEERRILKNNSYGVIDLPKDAVVEVIFGCEAEASAISEMKRKIASRGLKPVFKTAELPHSSYGLILI